MTEPHVSNVSHTAHWVAAHRAVESARPDALFKDPYAERLAGPRGKAIVAGAAKHMRNGWPVVVRTKSIDDLVFSSIAEGCDYVLSLAAGLDTRPYRLALPASLRWIEADLPSIIDEKEGLLANETPACHLVREKVDLADPSARGAFLDRALANAHKALVITEGLLMYLPEDVVRALAGDLARPGVQWWVFDIVSPILRDAIVKGMKGQLTNAPIPFAPANGVAFFELLGWKTRDIHDYVRHARRLGRLPWFLRMVTKLPFPETNPRDIAKARWAAVIRLER